MRGVAWNKMLAGGNSWKKIIFPAAGTLAQPFARQTPRPPVASKQYVDTKTMVNAVRLVATKLLL